MCMEAVKKSVEEINVGKLIHILSHHLRRQNTIAQKDIVLTHMQRHVLQYILLQSMKRDIYQKDIEKEFQIRKSTASGILQLMEKNGYILRVSDPQDSRLKKIVLTPSAEALKEGVLENIRRTERKLTQDIPAEELDQCKRVLQKMLSNLIQNERETKSESGRSS